MFIRTETTPNPATLKFLPGQMVLDQAALGQGTLDFSSPDSAYPSPLARRLFTLQGVVRVFLAGDFISVSKADDTDWAMLKPMVLAALMEHLSLGLPVVDIAAFKKSANSATDSEVITQIKELLDTRVRPMVARDGGDIVFDRFEDGIVYLHMQGACSGCPSSTLTLKSGIEGMLRHYVPEVLEVRAA